MGPKSPPSEPLRWPCGPQAAPIGKFEPIGSRAPSYNNGRKLWSNIKCESGSIGRTEQKSNPPSKKPGSPLSSLNRQKANTPVPLPVPPRGIGRGTTGGGSQSLPFIIPTVAPRSLIRSKPDWLNLLQIGGGGGFIASDGQIGRGKYQM